jgi:prophage regulatory protein
MASTSKPLQDLRPFSAMSPEELAGFTEVAEMLGVHRRTAQRYIGREDFPEPVGRLAGGRVWRRDDVEAWGRTHLPLPRSGRPRKI